MKKEVNKSFVDYFIDEALPQNKNRIKIESGGGFSKTTSLKELCKRLIDNYNCYKIIPLLLDCNNIKDSVELSIARLFGKVEYDISDKETLEILVNNSLSNSVYSYLFIFDGLNEVDDSISDLVLDFIKGLSSKNFVIISSRYNDDEILRNFTKIAFTPLADKVIEDFVENSIITSKLKLVKLLRNPMMLSIFIKANSKYAFQDVENQSQLLDVFFKEQKRAIAYREKYSKLTKQERKLFRYIIDVLLPVLCSSEKYLFSENEIEVCLKGLYKNKIFKSLIQSDENRYDEIKIDKEIAFILVKEFLRDDLKIIKKENGNYKIHQIYADYFHAKYYEEAINQNILELFENELTSDVRLSIGELIGEYKFEDKQDTNSEKSPLEAFMQNNSSNLSPIAVSNIIEIMKISRNNKITAIYNNLDLTQALFYNTDLENSLFDNSIVNISSFKRPFVDETEIKLAVASNNNKYALFLSRNNIRIHDMKTKRLLKSYLLSKLGEEYYEEFSDAQENSQPNKKTLSTNEKVFFFSSVVPMLTIENGKIVVNESVNQIHCTVEAVNAIENDAFIITILAGTILKYLRCSVEQMILVEKPEEVLSEIIDQYPNRSGEVWLPLENKDLVIESYSDTLSISYKSKELTLQNKGLAKISSFSNECEVVAIIDEIRSNEICFVNCLTGEKTSFFTTIESTTPPILFNSKIYQCFNDGFLRGFDKETKAICYALPLFFEPDKLVSMGNAIFVQGGDDLWIIDFSEDNIVQIKYSFIHKCSCLSDSIVILEGFFYDVLVYKINGIFKFFTIHHNECEDVLGYSYQEKLDCVTFFSNNAFNIIHIDNGELSFEKYDFDNEGKYDFPLCYLTNQNDFDAHKFISDCYNITPIYCTGGRMLIAGYAPHYSPTEYEKALYILELENRVSKLKYFKEISEEIGLFDISSIYFEKDTLYAYFETFDLFEKDNIETAQRAMYEININTFAETINSNATKLNENHYQNLLSRKTIEYPLEFEINYSKLLSCNICGCKFIRSYFDLFDGTEKYKLEYNGALVEKRPT